MSDVLAVRRGARALVTGASSGIGAAFARELAARGLNIVITARREDRLRELASELRQRSAVEVDTIVADLGEAGGLAQVVDAIAARPVDVLINNAGFGTHGAFVKLDPKREADEVALNCSAVVALAHAAAPSMVQRRSGAIVNVASTAAFQGLPYMAVYGATKAFVLSFSVGLAGELASDGVRVTALCPGPTETEFFEAGNVARFPMPSRTSEQVVATALRAIERGRSVALDGPFNAVLAAAPRFLPRSVITRMVARSMGPRTA